MIARRAVCLGLAAAVASPAVARGGVEVLDDLGRLVRLPRPAARVVALSHHAYAQMAALRLRPVGAFANPAFAAMTKYLFDRPETIPSMVHADWSPDAELIAMARPDLILAYGDRSARQLGMRAPVFLIDDHKTPEAMIKNLLRLADLTAREAQAAEALAALEARRGEVAAKAGPRPRAVWLLPGDGRVSIAGRSHLTHRLMSEFADVVAPEGDGWIETTAEALHALDPDVALVGDWAGEGLPSLTRRLARDPFWARLRALREGRLRTYPGYQDLSVRGVPTALRLFDVAPDLIREAAA